MHHRSRRYLSVRLITAAGLAAALGTTLYAHNHIGLVHPTLARARVQSPNASTVDLPVPIDGTGLSTVCFKVRNTSPFDARITAIGFDLPDSLTGFTLTSPASSNFHLIEEVANVPEIPSVTLDFALVTGRTFAGGRPALGLPPSETLTTFCVTGPFSQTTPIERMLDRTVLRFQRVGADGEEGDIAVWETWPGPTERLGVYRAETAGARYSRNR